MSDCKPRQTAVCEEKVIQQASSQKTCEDFSICLPFGGRLHSDGNCIAYDEPASVPENGIYGKVVVQNGCIIGVQADEAYQYSATPCAPVPVPCDCDGEGGGVKISTQAGNLITQDATGALLAKLHYVAGDGIDIYGDGTTSSPLTISATGGSGGSGAGVYGEDHITVAVHDGNYFVKHDKTGKGTQTYGTITVDEYGHVTGYTEASVSGVAGVVGGEGVTVETNNNTGIATVSLSKPLEVAEGDWTLGGYKATIDAYGRVTNIKRAITLSAGTYSLGDYDVTVNAYGSVTGIKKNSSGGGTTVSGISSPAGVMGSAAWTGNLNPISVEFTLAVASPVRVLLTPAANNASHSVIADIDGSVDFGSIANYLGGQVIYTRSTLSAGKHVFHMHPSSISGGSEQVAYLFDIQAYTPAVVTGDNN